MKLATPELTTREAIARSILENGPSSAVALSERLGITPAGIRRHLDALVEEGIIEPREPRTRELGRGRPSKVFVMTDMGRTSFEHSYDDLAIAALRYLAQSQPGGGDVRSFARTRAEEMERKFHNTSAKKSNSNPALALADFLTREGYAASTHEVPIGVEICQHHCPIAHVAAEFPQLCETETEIFSKILGTHVQRLATIAHGDGVCTTVIPRNRTDLFFNSKTDSPTERTER